MRTTLLVLLSLFTTAPLVAGPFDARRSSSIDYTATRATPALPCSRMRQWTTADLTVVSAKPQEEPAACILSAVAPSEIRFEVALPNDWNGRFLMFGNGGLAGTPPESPARIAQRNRAVELGFATAYTDTGHDQRVEPGGTFAHQNLHKLIDYGYRAVHLTNQNSKELIAHYYGQAASFSYFDGCSTGGRQALMSAQRFPSDFDGIVAGAPANDYSGLKFSQASRMSAMKGGLFDLDAIDALAAEIYEGCDGLDGLEDGLISDPRRCDFDPQRDLPRCDSQTTRDCFSAEQIAALVAYYAPVELAGEVIYPPHPVGSEARGPARGGRTMPGWIPWLFNPNGVALLDRLGSDFFRYMVFVVDRPEFDWTEFDYAQEPDNLGYFRDIVDAVDPDLGEFHRRGGKIISYFGWADPDINPLTAIDYREQVEAATGNVDDFYRLFLVPGMFHCSGGPGPSDFDVMTPLIDWVEGGVAPDRIAARHEVDGEVRFSRPLCSDPLEAVYDGQGDPKSAESFRCE